VLRRHSRDLASVVSGEQEAFAGRAIDLSRLNEAELRVLRLLGEGHTVRSSPIVVISDTNASFQMVVSTPRSWNYVRDKS